MDLIIWTGMLVLMAFASYRAALLWRDSTRAFDAWPPEFQRAVPAAVWFGTAFFAAGAVLVLGDFGPGHPVSIAAALVAVVGGLGALILGGALVAWGRPRRLVPPHLREGGDATRPSRRGGRQRRAGA